MALKITKQIGTSRGITDSAYIRIVNYSINKYGYLQLNTQMFLSDEQAAVPLDQVVAGMECFNHEIGNMFKIPLTQTLTRTVEKVVMVDEEYEKKIPILDDNGNYTGQFNTEMVTQTIPKKMEVEEEYQVPNLAILDGQNVFEFGYNYLKQKLVAIFGSENITDC
jgi:hypothetical protein